MHFWVSAARVSLPDIAPGHLETSGARCPRKMGTNWFMPAFVNRRFGELGKRLAEGTMVWPLDLKKSKKDFLISVLVIRYFVKAVKPLKPLNGYAEGIWRLMSPPAHEDNLAGRTQGTQNCSELYWIRASGTRRQGCRRSPAP